ncbi:MAG: hypothetical protein EBU66_18670 [Bacteroidetes bacterium]|nr:hypothetical protein [bacterium]NBP66657.1 hypothetical protein [Bacteroidota bacterium]
MTKGILYNYGSRPSIFFANLSTDVYMKEEWKSVNIRIVHRVIACANVCATHARRITKRNGQKWLYKRIYVICAEFLNIEQ